MGLWERNQNDLFLDEGVYSFWSRDVPDPLATGKLPAPNSYSNHPVYMGKSPDYTYWYGVFQNNAAAVDYWI